jgi:hypothetical protein
MKYPDRANSLKGQPYRVGYTYAGMHVETSFIMCP